MALGDRTPFASVTSVSSVLTTCTMTFFAENWVPSDETCGTVPWNRSHTRFELLHRQNTSEAVENGAWTTVTFLPTRLGSRDV